MFKQPKELASIKDKIPKQIYEDLTVGVIVLDSEYGEECNYLQEGGYSVVIEAADDLAEFKAIVDDESHSAEWVVRESRNCGCLCCLFIVNHDFSIMFIPAGSYCDRRCFERFGGLKNERK